LLSVVLGFIQAEKLCNRLTCEAAELWCGGQLLVCHLLLLRARTLLPGASLPPHTPDLHGLVLCTLVVPSDSCDLREGFLLYLPNIAYTGTTACIHTELGIWQEVFGCWDSLYVHLESRL